MRAEAPPRGGSQNLQIPVLNGARPAGFGTRTSPVPLSNRTRLRLAQRCELPKQLFPYLTLLRHYTASGLLNLLTTLVRTMVRTTPGRKLQATKLTDSARIRHAAPGLASETTIYAQNRTRQIKNCSAPEQKTPPNKPTQCPAEARNKAPASGRSKRRHAHTGIRNGTTAARTETCRNNALSTAGQGTERRKNPILQFRQNMLSLSSHTEKPARRRSQTLPGTGSKSITTHPCGSITGLWQSMQS